MKPPTLYDHLLDEDPSRLDRFGRFLLKKRESFAEERKAFAEKRKGSGARLLKFLSRHASFFIVTGILSAILGAGYLGISSVREAELRQEEAAEARYKMLWETQPPKAKKKWEAWQKKFLPGKDLVFDCHGWQNFDWAKHGPDYDPSYHWKCFIAKKGEFPHKRVSCDVGSCQVIPVQSADE